MDEILVKVKETAKQQVMEVITENQSELSDAELITEQMQEWEREHASIHFELKHRENIINHFRVNRAIDLHFLMEAGTEFLGLSK